MFFAEYPSLISLIAATPVSDAPQTSRMYKIVAFESDGNQRIRGVVDFYEHHLPIQRSPLPQQRSEP